MSMLDLTITKPGGTSPVQLTATGISASWVVRPQASLSAEVVTAELIDATGTVDLRGRWIGWRHPSLPVWAGVIVASEPDAASGTTELAARDFTELLAARRTAKVYQLPASSAGGLAQRVVLDAGRDAPTWITEFAIDTGGRQVPLSANAEQVLSVVSRLADDSGHAWRIDEDRVFTWRQQLGTDHQATVALVEGVQLSHHRLSLLSDPVVNDLLAIPADADFGRTRAIVREDPASIQTIGRRQDSIVYDGMVDRAQLAPAADADLARLTIAGQTLTADIANVDDVWDDLHAGDTVWVVVPSWNWQGGVRLMVLQYDSDRETLSISGDLTEAVS